MTSHPDRTKLDQLSRRIERIVFSTPVIDIHTHLYDPAFRDLLLWGIDELLVYHYLVAEGFRFWDRPYAEFWDLPKADQAERIWDTLFVQRSPVSEACRGVVTALSQLGLDAWKRDLDRFRRWFAKQTVEGHVDRCLETARISKLFMTNSPFDDLERPLWEKRFRRDPRFSAALRIDPILVDWSQAVLRLTGWGYRVTEEISRRTVEEVTRFLRDWTKRMDAQYVMVSLPPEFAFPARTPTARLIEKVILPFCRDQNLPFALMLGVKRSVNAELRLAGDGVGRSDLAVLEHLCAAFPHNKYLVTVLSRENQHELCVLARKFRNLHLFGCWWFTNVPHVIDEMTRLRLELLGSSVTLQHSDARVLDQVVYKWHHFRQVLARVLMDKYSDLVRAGWEPSVTELQRDVQELCGGAFERFCAMKL